MNNYISGVRFLHKVVGVEAPALLCFNLALTLRASRLMLRRPPHRKLPFTLSTLQQLCHMCDILNPFGVVMKVAILFGFFGMLRQSNLAPRSQGTFDPSRHTCRGDVLFQTPGIVIIMKWAKTIQSFDQLPLIPIPAIPGAILDPCAAYKALLKLAPTRRANDPLLCLPRRNGITVVTTTHLSHCLRIMLESLSLDPSSYSLHSLRRSGATAAYAAGVDGLAIQRHGTWSSPAFLDYVMSSEAASSPVASALARASQD